MKTQKLHAGTAFQALSVYDQHNNLVDISKPTGDADWQKAEAAYKAIAELRS